MSELRTVTDGACSFCGAPSGVFVQGSDVQICDKCIGLCFSILGEESGRPFHDHYRTFAEIPPASELPDELLAPILEKLATMERPARPAAGPGSEADFRCSFCGRAKEEVAKLVSGPRVFICEHCIAAAATIVKREMKRAELNPHG